jgi:hypothetical protein
MRAQVQGWVSVFGIATRYPARIRNGLKDWVRDFLNSKQYENRPTAKQLRRDFAAKAQWLSQNSQIKTIAEAALRAAAFQYLADDAPDDMLEGYAAMANSQAVLGIPSALNGN